MYRSCVLLLIISALFSGCAEDDAVTTISIIEITVDGNSIKETENKVGLSPKILITFNAAVDANALKNAIRFNGGTSEVVFTINFNSNSSQVTIIPTLENNTDYTFELMSAIIGKEGQKLTERTFLNLVTDRGLLTPCTSASPDCLKEKEFEADGSTYSLSYYSTYDLANTVDLSQIDQAIILVHGANRNGDDYFRWMNKTLSDLSISNSTILIAPFFKSENESELNDLYWSGNNWREGDDTINDFKISSFAIMDTLVQELYTKVETLRKIIVTGHSSGGMFTHLYATANRIENLVPTHIGIQYVVANSQYFYYPGEERINEDNNQLYIPSGCNGYDLWPFGFELNPNYITNESPEFIGEQLSSRTVYYLIGNGNQSDPSLNTSNCAATLLGSTRYQRGENVFTYMEAKYPDNNHSRVIVEGIGHNGQAIYQSEKFKQFLLKLIK